MGCMHAAVQTVAHQQNTGGEHPVRNTAVAWKLQLQRLTLQLWVSCPATSPSLITQESIALFFTGNSFFDKDPIYTRYKRRIVLTMADTDSDKFPLHTAAREGRGIERLIIPTHLSFTKLTWPSLCSRRSPQGRLKKNDKANTHKHLER